MSQYENEIKHHLPPWIDDSQDAIYKGFVEHFKALEDPRMFGKTGHNLLEIIFISVCAYLCGANSWDGVYEFAKIREVWLKKYIHLFNGLPSRVTYWRTLAQLNPMAFQHCFQDWAGALLGKTRHIAIDGKALRGVYNPTDPDATLILVSAWATDCSLLLGQIKTEIKSNEIIAIPKLLDTLRIKDCLVSIDAMGCQTAIAKKITTLGGDYLFALKGNQSALRDDVEYFFQDALKTKWKDIDYESCESVEKGHGRIDSRKVYLVRNNMGFGKENWPNLQSILMVSATRSLKNKESTENRYYITSSGMGVTEMGLAIRKHWGIENGLHWSLDVGFREDRQVAQKENLAENLAVLRRIAFNYLKQDSSTLSIENKRLKAAMDPSYLERLLSFSSQKIS